MLCRQGNAFGTPAESLPPEIGTALTGEGVGLGKGPVCLFPKGYWIPKGFGNEVDTLFGEVHVCLNRQHIGNDAFEGGLAYEPESPELSEEEEEVSNMVFSNNIGGPTNLPSEEEEDAS